VEAFKQGKADGIGWSLPLDGIYWGVDVDNGIDPESGEFVVWKLDNGDLAAVQPQDALILPTYGEKTPSNAGYRMLFRCKVPIIKGSGNKQKFGQPDPGTAKTPQIEMYSQGRFFTFTGNHVPNTPTTIEDCTKEALAVLPVANPVRDSF
jgi:putative DNA primase/helicase